jgi:ribosomal protein S18 acetylase RimI-like enzyme
MTDVVIAPEGDFDSAELVALYDSVGWTAYTASPEQLADAVAGSSFVVGARRDGRLVGLARAVSDGVSICYLQDVVVDPDCQRAGIGRALVVAALDYYAHVRQKVLLTDDEPGQRAFYESLGYSEVGSSTLATLRAFARFDG